MVKALTIKDLYKECKYQINKGNGDKVIMISDDDEGNGYHYCWYLFSTPDELMLDDYIINEKVAEKDNTIILG